jgi:hypothetical protein
MQWKGFLQSLASMAISGAITGATTYMSTGHFNGKQLGMSAGVGAIVGVGNLFVKPPNMRKQQEEPK